MIILSLYLVIDGVGSIVIFRKQAWYNHIPRLIRAGIGLFLLVVFN
jgi:hypothetical protein